MEGLEDVGIQDVHGESDREDDCQSFRQSFYTGGTDWSRLYEADDYGVPFSCFDEEKQNEAVRHEPSACAVGNYLGQAYCSPESAKTSSAERVHTSASISGLDKRVDTVSGRLRNAVVAIREHKPSAKLVQSDLSNFLGIRPKANLEKALSGKRHGEQGFRMPLEIPSPLQSHPGDTAEFLTNFNRVDKGKVSTGKRRRGSFTGTSDGDQAAPRKCPFYKKIPGTNFTVDAFRYGEVEGCRAYFLTHFHADHYGGLTKRWCHGPIYCSPTTARLVVLCLGVGPRWIVPLELGETFEIDGLRVRMLEANHCPGAALILFRFQSGHQILHTGDFRACKDMQSYPELLSGKINTLYLDTTYCNERYRFPLQQEVINFVIRQTANALSKNLKTLVAVGSYSIGKERVYVTMAEALGVPIFADAHRRRVLKALEWPALASRLSTDSASTFLHVLPLSNLNPQRLKEYLQTHHPKYNAVLAFRPTGWTYSNKLGNKLEFLKPQRSGPVTIYGVPYSEHSSFPELQEFVQFLRPSKIIPTVNNAKEEQRERMKCIFNEWLGSKM